MKVSNLYHLSKNLQKIKKSLTSSQIAKGSGISRATIYNWEHLKAEPTILNLRKVANFLNVSVSELIGHKKGKFSK